MAEKKCIEFSAELPDTRREGMKQISLEEFLTRLRKARGTVQTEFSARLLDHAIFRTEKMLAQDGRRSKGSPPRISKPNKDLVSQALAARDVERILSIRDKRGSNGADDEQLEGLISELCGDDDSNVSTRKIGQEAKRRGLRADRGRINKLREKLQFGRDESALRAKRVASLDYIDLTFVHVQSELLVLGFVVEGCDTWVERIAKLEEDTTPSLLIAPTSADRARITSLVAQLAETIVTFSDCSPNWELLLRELAGVGEKMALLHISSGEKVPSHVADHLRQIAPVVVDYERGWLLKELMRPQLFLLGAGYLPTLADTLERLASAPTGGQSIGVCQSAAARTDALWLRLRLQEEFAKRGILVNVDDRQAFRLSRHATLKSERAAEDFETALLVPSPIELPMFHLNEPSQAETLRLDFSGADHILAQSRVDDLVGIFNRALRLQRDFALRHHSEPMRGCAEYFCAPESRLSAIRDTMGRRPDFRKMTKEVRAIWAAYVLTLFDPDVLQMDFGSIRSGESPFPRSFEDFCADGAKWIDHWRWHVLRANSRPDNVSYVVEEAIESTVVVLEHKLSRVWKFGMDAAAQRMTTAIERAGREKYYSTNWRTNPQEAIPRLAAYFEGVWPTVWVTRKSIVDYAYSIFRSTLLDLQKRSGTFTSIISDAEEETSGVPESTLSSPSIGSLTEEQVETPEMLIRERLKSPIAEGDDRRLAMWYARLLAAVRNAVETDPDRPLFLPDVLPSSQAELLLKAVQRSLAGGKLSGVAKALSKALEKFFADQR